MAGAIRVRRSRWLGFPTYELTTQNGPTVGLARYSALNIYFFGKGQRIALPEGVRWRVTAVARGPALATVLYDEARGRLAMAAAGAAAGNYGIVGKDYAYTLNPAEGGWGRARIWELFAGERPVARLTRRPFGAQCAEPVPLPALLLSLLFVRFGIPGENELRMPGMYQRMHGGRG